MFAHCWRAVLTELGLTAGLPHWPFCGQRKLAVFQVGWPFWLFWPFFKGRFAEKFFCWPFLKICLYLKV